MLNRETKNVSGDLNGVILHDSGGEDNGREQARNRRSENRFDQSVNPELEVWWGDMCVTGIIIQPVNQDQTRKKTPKHRLRFCQHMSAPADCLKYNEVYGTGGTQKVNSQPMRMATI